eukprot:scaffold9047_cov131-Cylindrotheca_fusiformis.AAC.1
MSFSKGHNAQRSTPRQSAMNKPQSPLSETAMDDKTSSIRFASTTTKAAKGSPQKHFPGARLQRRLVFRFLGLIFRVFPCGLPSSPSPNGMESKVVVGHLLFEKSSDLKIIVHMTSLVFDGLFPTLWRFGLRISSPSALGVVPCSNKPII